MGQWLKHHLTGLGHTVSGYDERRDDNPSTLAEADLIIVSVPISVTAEVIRNTVKHMKKGACLMEIASLKTGIHEALLEAASHGFDVLCVHPLFGPSVDNLDGKTVAVIPVMDIECEKAIAARLFPGATLEVVDVCEHDRLMSVILSLSISHQYGVSGDYLRGKPWFIGAISWNQFHASIYFGSKHCRGEDKPDTGIAREPVSP